MNDGFFPWLFGICVGLFFGFYFSLWLITKDNIVLPEKKWNCTQAKIIDPLNVNKSECIVYKKGVNDDIG